MPVEIMALVEIAIVLTVAVLLPLLTYLWGYNRGAYKVEQSYDYPDLNKIEKRLVRHLQREIKWLRSLLRVVSLEELRQPDATAVDAAQEPLSLAAAKALLLGRSRDVAEALADLKGWHLYIAHASPALVEPDGYESPWVAVVIQREQVTEVAAVG